MCTRCVFLGGTAALIAAPTVAQARTGDPEALELALPRMWRVNSTVWLGRLTPNVWIHTTMYRLPGIGYYPAHGAIVIAGNESLLIDTGWNDATTEALLSIWEQLQKPRVTRALVTHFHADSIGRQRRAGATWHPRLCKPADDRLGDR